MFNFRPIQIPSVTAITAAILLIAGCGGGGGGGGGVGANFPTPTLPVDAVVFNSANAEDGTTASLNSAGSLITAASARGTNASFTVQDAFDLVTARVLNSAKNSQPVATGATTVTTCTGPGGGTVTETGNATATGGTGTMTFSNCDMDGISIINGNFSFILAVNDPIFDFDFGGSLTFTLVAPPNDVVSMVMNSSQTINTNTFAFTISQTYSVSGVPIGASTGGFLVTTIVPLELDSSFEVINGQLLIQGASGSQIRFTVTAPNVATVEVDDGTGGGFVVVTTSYAII